jgi:CheY-like chemotaxis protein
MISQYLKQADKLLLQHNFDAAEKEVNKALELDPANLYAHAYIERIRSLRREFEGIRKREEEQRRLTETTKKERGKKSATRHPANSEAVEEYKSKLYEFWRGGMLSSQEQLTLEQLRDRLDVSDDEHEELEREMKLRCYVEAVKQAAQSWTPSPGQPSPLEEVRKRFGITAEEHLSVEGNILWELRQRKHQVTIMLVDDEVELLTLLGEGLKSEGYRVLTALSPEEALHQLKNTIPDLIISDVGFANSSLDGFAIYSKVRSTRELMTVPFVFLTGARDEAVLQRGLGVGADDVISKPFTMSTILSIIEGKLHRYEELKKAFRAS